MQREKLKYKVLFPVEVAARELIYKLFLSIKLADSGMDSFIGNKKEIMNLMDVIYPFIYFDKGYHVGVSDKIYDRINERQGIIVNLDEEGGIGDHEFSWLTPRFPEKVFSLFSLIFFWGEEQYKYFKETRKNFNENNAVVSGMPRFELLKQRYLSIYEEDVKAIKEKYGRYILVDTSAKFSNNVRGKSFVISNYSSRVKDIEHNIQVQENNTLNTIRLVRELAKKTDFNIIIRPHPEERHETYLSELSDLPNVQVVYEKSVIPWIIGAEVLIQTDCTTGVESFLLGKKSISNIENPLENRQYFLPYELSYQTKNNSEIIDFIVNEKYKIPEDNRDLNTLMNSYLSFDKNSTEIIIENIQKMVKKGKETRKYMVHSERISILKKLEYLSTKLIRLLRYKFEFVFQREALVKQKLAGLSQTEVYVLFEKIIKVAETKGKIKIRCIGPFIYQVYKCE